LHGFRLSVDYSRDFGNGYAISFGLQPQFVNISGTLAYDKLGIPNNEWGSYTSLENEVDLNRFIHAAYGNLAGQINKLIFKAGLWIEYTNQVLDIENPNYFSLFERPAQQRFVVNQLDWLPGFHSTYPITNTVMFNFAASRISRAPVKNMASFLYRRHLEVYVVGEPMLKPEYINIVELTYNKTIADQQIGLTGYDRAVNNAIFRVNTVFEDELILIRTFTNAGYTQSLRSEMNANFELGRKAKLY
jgi:iron complex outermembrane recepter protein